MESFNNLCAVFISKHISIKDPIHYKGQACTAAMQFNYGYATTTYSICNYLDNKREKTGKRAGLSKSKKQRKVKKNKNF